MLITGTKGDKLDTERAEPALVRGAADLIAIGRPFIANPDLVERYRNEWPLAPLADPATWYAGEPTSAGYTDFPTHASVERKVKVA